jgi:hypothetical protein
MNQEMMDKLEELFQSGKITKEQKELLVKALEQKNSQESQNLEITTVLGIEKKELQIKLLDEDIEVQGDNTATQVAIIKGSELVEVVKTENKILIQSKKENANFLGNFLKISESKKINVIIPESMQTSVKTVSGDIEVENLQSEIAIKSVSGDISLISHLGTIMINNISGDIEVKKVIGQADITSKSGDIQINRSDIKGSVKTYSGDIQIDKSALENVEVSVFSGDITIADSTGNQQLQCKTFSGDVQISLTNATGYVKGFSASGEIELITADNSHIDLSSQDYGDSNDPLQILIKTTSGDGKIRFTNE